MQRLERLFGLIPASALLRAERAYGGALQTLAGDPRGHRVVARAHVAAGRALGALARVAHLAAPGETPRVAQATMRRFFTPILADESSDADGYAFSFTRCPYGLEGPSQGELCRAIMNLEERLVRELGGELVIHERIADGAPRCRFSVERPGATTEAHRQRARS